MDEFESTRLEETKSEPRERRTEELSTRNVRDKAEDSENFNFEKEKLESDNKEEEIIRGQK